MQRLARDGVDCIKVYSHADEATFAAISAAAEQAGLPTIGHVPHLVGLRNLSNFEAQHLSGLPYLHRDPPWLVADRESNALVAMSDSDIDEALSLAYARNVSLTPTIANTVLRLVVTDSERFAPPPATRHLPDVWRQIWPSVIAHPTTESEVETEMASTRMLRRIAGRARARGVDVLAGSDTIGPYTIPGEALLLEIEELARAFADNEGPSPRRPSSTAAISTMGGSGSSLRARGPIFCCFRKTRCRISTRFADGAC